MIVYSRSVRHTAQGVLAHILGRLPCPKKTPRKIWRSSVSANSTYQIKNNTERRLQNHQRRSSGAGVRKSLHLLFFFAIGYPKDAAAQESNCRCVLGAVAARAAGVRKPLSLLIFFSADILRRFLCGSVVALARHIQIFFARKNFRAAKKKIFLP